MGEAGVVWEVEEIPNPARLFLRVHEGLVRDGQLHPGIFREGSSAFLSPPLRLPSFPGRRIVPAIPSTINPAVSKNLI